MNIPALLPEIAGSLAHLLLPKLCAGCSVPLLRHERLLCMGCMLAMPQTGFHHIPDNEAALRLAGRIPYCYASAFAYFEPGGLLQHLLHLLKYQGRKEAGTYLGAQAAYAMRMAPWTATVDVIVPMPLHPGKEAARGYNQAAVIARELGRVLGIPVAEGALRRIRHTDSQTTKSREARVQNVLGAFRLADKSPLAGRHVLLVDDVLTTGATLEAAAGPLLQAPGLRLSIFTIGLAMS